MINFYVNLVSLDWFSVISKLYARALIESGAEVRVLPTRHDQVIDPAFYPPEFLVLSGAFAKAGPAADTAIYCGSPKDVVRFYADPDHDPRYKMAITYWDSEMTPEVAAILADLTLILVPDVGMAQKFQAAGVTSVYALRIPVIDQDPEGLDVEPLPEGIDELFYAIGRWEQVERCVRWFINQSESTQVMHIVCPDVPFASKSELEGYLSSIEFAGATPIISIDRTSLNRSPTDWAATHVVGETYLTDGRFFDPNLPGALAMSRVYRVDSEDTAEWVSAGEKVVTSLTDAGTTLRAIVEFKSDMRLGVVISHHNRGIEYVCRLWESLQPQLGVQDLVIFASDCQDDEFWQSFASRIDGLPTITYRAEEWSQARCRNTGAQSLIVDGASAILFLDADLIIPDGAIEELRALYRMGHDVIVPAHIVEGKKDRPGPGVPMVDVRLFTDLRGYDEEYVGYGSEDIDFLWRATQYRGKKELLAEVAFAHQPHELVTDGAPMNMERLHNRMSGLLGPVNPRGWGLVEGGEA